MDLAQTLERIDPTPLAPWRIPVFTEIDIESGREEAKNKAAVRRGITDKALPPSHTRRLYDSLSQNRAYLLTRQTGHCNWRHKGRV
jgi:hypothetical protein